MMAMMMVEMVMVLIIVMTVMAMIMVEMAMVLIIVMTVVCIYVGFEQTIYTMHDTR